MSILDTDTRIYILSGLFTIAVFVLAIVAVVRWGLEITTGTILMLSVGFFGFMAVYFIAMAVYRGIERKERAD